MSWWPTERPREALVPRSSHLVCGVPLRLASERRRRRAGGLVVEGDSERVLAPLGPPRPDAPLRFDLDQIDASSARSGSTRRPGSGGSTRTLLEPLVVGYGELVDDMDGVTRATLAFLGIELPAHAALVPMTERQADGINAEWAERYRALRRAVSAAAMS